jgi:REP element-mobilizing transposase RayT
VNSIVARPLRREYPGAWYHVTCRGNERRAIFRDDGDRERFLRIVDETRELFGVEVHGYVLMENHVHLILMTPEANLQKFMQRLNTSYTVSFNRRHRRSGHLFQGRYKAILIDADSYLVELSRYLHLNPVRVKRYSRRDVEEKTGIIRSYRWSSYRGYVEPRHRERFLICSPVLEMVGGGDDRKGRRRYGEFVLGGIAKDMNITFWEGVRGQAVLGSDEFVEWVFDRFLAKREVDAKEFPRFGELERGPETVEEIGRRVAGVFQVPETELRRRRSRHGGARSVFMELCCLCLARKKGLGEIGRELGGVSVSALSQNRPRLAARMKRDPRLKEHFQHLREAFRQNPRLE